MIKALFFDLGNVLAREGFTSGISLYEKKYHVPKGQLYASCHDKPFWREFSLGNISEKEYFENVAKDFGQSLDIEVLRTLIYQNFVPNVPLLEFIKTLKHTHILGVISNCPKEWFDFFWEMHDWKNIFSVRAISADLHIRKPDVRIFTFAMQQAGVLGSESLYIDDRDDRVSGATAVDMRVVLFKDVNQIKRSLVSLMSGI